jgi:preprotein translocase subunit SecA
MRQGVLHDLFRTYVPADSVEEQWDIRRGNGAGRRYYQLKLPIGEWLKAEPNLSDDDIPPHPRGGDRSYADKVDGWSAPPPSTTSSAT